MIDTVTNSSIRLNPEQRCAETPWCPEMRSCAETRARRECATSSESASMSLSNPGYSMAGRSQSGLNDCDFACGALGFRCDHGAKCFRNAIVPFHLLPV